MEYIPSLKLWKHNLAQPATPGEGQRRRMPINPITDRRDTRMSTYQVRFKNTSEAPVLKKKEKKKEKSSCSLC